MRYFKYIILLFIIVFSSIFFLKKEKSLKVISLSHNTNQVIKKDSAEIIRIPILVNQDSQDFTIIENISEAYLITSTDKTLVKIDNIKFEDYVINYLDENFYSYMFDIDSKSISHDLHGNDAIFKMILNSGKTVEFNIGRIDLVFDDVEELSPVYISSKSDFLAEYYTVTEVIIGLVSSRDLNVKKIFIESKDSYINNEKIEVAKSLDDLKNNHNSNLIYYEKNEEQIDLKIKKDEVIFLKLPIEYLDKTYNYRFYIGFLTENEKIYFDDFLYLNQGYFPNFMFNEANIYE